jgi:hypothetical protein
MWQVLVRLEWTTEALRTYSERVLKPKGWGMYDKPMLRMSQPSDPLFAFYTVRIGRKCSKKMSRMEGRESRVYYLPLLTWLAYCGGVQTLREGRGSYSRDVF